MFKEGDKILRIGPDFFQVQKDKIYTFDKMSGQRDDILFLKEFPGHTFDFDKFKLVDLSVLGELGD